MDPTMHMGVPGGPAQAGPSWLSPAPDHGAALVALLFLPVVLVTGLTLLNHLARRSPAAALVVRRIAGSRPGVNLAVLLMLVTADIHIALIPAHMSEPLVAALFLLDALGFVGVGCLAYSGRRWQLAAATLVVATIGAYAFYVGTGREDLDLIGLATTAVEVSALGAIAVSAVVGDPDRPRRRSHRQRPYTGHKSQPQEVLG